MSETAVMTTSEVADELGTDPKTLRKFFRSEACDITPVGQGKRYAITEDDIDDLRTAFDLWAGGKAKKADKGDDDAEPAADKAPAKAKKSSKKKSTKKAAPVVEDDPDEDLSFDDEEPTPDALAELDDEPIEDLDLGDDD